MCSVALAKEGKLLSLQELNSKNGHAEILNGFIEAAISEGKCILSDLDAVAVSQGPGSYTGLRIGVSTAKGLCYSLDIPLIAIDTLESLAGLSKAAYREEFGTKEDVLFCPMIDARRMEAYTAHFNLSGEMTRKVDAEIIDELTYEEILNEKKVVFSGDGSAKYQELYKSNPNAIFHTNILCSAKGMIQLAESKFNSSDFVDLAYFEPFYFKSFVAGLPRVKGLR